jgi:hypothetical protein
MQAGYNKIPSHDYSIVLAFRGLSVSDYQENHLLDS